MIQKYLFYLLLRFLLAEIYKIDDTAFYKLYHYMGNIWVMLKQNVVTIILSENCQK